MVEIREQESADDNSQPEPNQQPQTPRPRQATSNGRSTFSVFIVRILLLFINLLVLNVYSLTYLCSGILQRGSNLHFMCMAAYLHIIIFLDVRTGHDWYYQFQV